MTFGQRLKTLRERRGMSQRFLARDAGLSDAQIVYLEKDRSIPKADTLAALAEVLGYTMDELYYGKGRLDSLS